MGKKKDLKWKKEITDFFKPNKTKILLSFLTTLIWFMIYHFLVMLTNPNVTVLEILQTYFNISGIFNFLFIVLWSYPFASALYHLWSWYKKGKLKSAIMKKKVLLCIIVFNPITLTLITGVLYSYLIFSTISQLPDIECGIHILDVFPDSPAERAGLHSGLDIITVNGEIMETVSEFTDLIKNTKPGDKIFISDYLNGSTYTTLHKNKIEIILEKYPSGNNNYGYIGVNLTQRFTKDGYPCR